MGAGHCRWHLACIFFVGVQQLNLRSDSGKFDARSRHAAQFAMKEN
jgi:hypothetical protein